jgi:hypothetical protein
MSLTKEETFRIEEYKLLRKAIAARVKDVSELNRWGLLGLAAMYSYIFANFDELWLLLWVPAGFSAIIIVSIWEQHKRVAEIAEYIRTYIEGDLAPENINQRNKASDIEPNESPERGGWERFLIVKKRRREVPSLWVSGPTTIWIAICFGTLAIAIVGVFFGAFPKEPRATDQALVWRRSPCDSEREIVMVYWAHFASGIEAGWRKRSCGSVHKSPAPEADAKSISLDCASSMNSISW